MSTLTCKKCGATKPIERFVPQSSNKARKKKLCWDCENARTRAWYHANLGHVRERAKQKRLQDKADTLAAYSQTAHPSCCCCGESELSFLTLDHAFGNGKEDRLKHHAGSRLYGLLRRQGYPKDRGFQTLCFNCNSGRQVNGGFCPHEEKKEQE